MTPIGGVVYERATSRHQSKRERQSLGRGKEEGREGERERGREGGREGGRERRTAGGETSGCTDKKEHGDERMYSS